MEQLRQHEEYKPENYLPAVFPYEGKAAIMAELNRVSGIVPQTVIYPENEVLKRAENVLNLERTENLLNLKRTENLLSLEQIAEEHIDNMVDGEQMDSRKINKVF